METFFDLVVKTAFIEAEKASEKGEIPVGAVIFNAERNEIIASAGNLVETTKDVTAHAEIVALRQACFKKDSVFLSDCDLYVTLEPCAMCATAISFARIRRLYFGAYDVKSGGVEHGAHVYQTSSCHFKPDVYGGIREEKASALLKNFFSELRKN